MDPLLAFNEDRHSGLGDGFYPKERELVFDIDMDAYDDVRTCCKEGKICNKDWSYMAAAILVPLSFSND